MSISILTANRVTKPSITLLSRVDGDKILLECRLNDYYPDKLTVQWFRDDQQVSTPSSDKKLQNADKKEKTFTVISQLAINAQNLGKLYTCKATHNSEEITQNYNVCQAQDFYKPLMYIKKPHLREIMDKKEVTTSCVVEAPHSTEVTWSVNGVSKRAREFRIDLSSSRTQNIVSNLTLPKEEWSKLKTMVCTAKHPCFEIQKPAIEADNIQKDPVVVIRRSFRESLTAAGSVLECVVQDAPLGEVCITFQANGVHMSGISCSDVTSSENIWSLATDFTIPSEHHKKDKTFTCTVNSHSKKWTSKPTGNIFDDPTVELSLVPSVGESSSNSQKLVCSGTGFDPKIRWLSQSVEKRGTAVDVTVGKDGRLNVYSEILVPQKEWNQGVMFTCEVTDSHINKPVQKSTSICAAQDFYKPLMYIKKPHLREIMDKKEVTTSCVVEAPHSTEVTWSVNGVSKRAREFRIDLSSSRTQNIVSNLTLPKEEWSKLKTMVCTAKHPCFEIQKPAIEADNIQKDPVVVIRRSFRESLTAAGTVLECVVQDAPLGEVCITFQANGVHMSGISCSDVTPSENIWSLATDFTIPSEHHKKDKTFTCTVNSHSKKWTSKPTGNIFDDPTVELSLVPSVGESSSNSQKLVCSGTGFDPKIRWLSQSVEKRGTAVDVTVGKDGRLNVYSEILVPQKEWNQGVTFTCEVTDSHINKPVQKSTSICAAQDFYKPLMYIKKPHLREIMDKKEVTTSCVVEAPHSTEVTWSVNGVSKRAREFRIDLSSSRTQNIVSNLTLPKEEWSKLKTMVCTAKHPCFEIQKPAIEADNIQKDPVVVIRRSFRESLTAAGTVLECVVQDAPLGEVCITFQANGVHMSGISCSDVTSSENIWSLATDFTIPSEHHKKDKTFTCTVNSHSKKWTSKPTGNIFDDPTVELSLVPSVGESSSNSQKLVCSGTGFDPKIRWLSQSVEKRGTAVDVTVGKDGRLNVYSEILVPQKEWNQGVTFTCEVTDSHINKPVQKSTSICAVSERGSQLVDVFLLGPSLSDMRSGSDVSLTCLVVGHRVEDFTIQWKEDGNNPSLRDYLQRPQNHANGTQSIQSILKVPVRTWNSYSQFTCEVKLFCSGVTQKKQISKTKDPKPPAVRILKPSESDLSGSQNTSLLCLITGFFPSDISVDWQLNGTHLDVSHFTNSPVVAHTASEGYSVFSSLILPASPWEEGTYSCVVSHESSKNPIIDSLDNLYASLTQSAPSAKLLQGSNVLVCLAFGFSPSAINITWLLGVTELSDHNVTSPAKGPDGKFSIQSHLPLLFTEWVPGEVYTCRVTHVTGILLHNISKPEIFEEAIFMNENKAESIAQDSVEETWRMACAFLVLFLFSLFYGCTVTMVKVKS